MPEAMIEGSSEKVTEDEAAVRINQTMKLSIKDGGFAALMVGFGEFYLPALAVMMRASPFQVSMLGSFPQFCSSMLQLLAVKLTNIFTSRKRIVMTLFAIQVPIWLLILIASLFFNSVWLLIGLWTLYFMVKEMIIPAWSSWIGDIVPEDRRGKFFGMRNRVAGASTFFAVILGGVILEYLEAFRTFGGFAALFFLCFLSGLVSLMYVSREFEPIVKVRVPKEFGFRKFLRNINKNNFGIFTIYISLIHFGTFLVAPLFTLYWLRDLGFSYIQYMVILSAAAVSGFVTITYWGANADYYGNKTILSASSILIGIIPAAWYFTRYMSLETAYSFGIIAQLLGGFAWAGFNLSTGNFIFDSVKVEDRVRSIAYFNTLKGISIFAGSMIGGIIASITFHNPVFLTIFPTGFMFLLVISTFFRLGVSRYYIPKLIDIKEPPQKPKFVHFAMVMPIQGVLFDSIVGMNRTIKKFKQRLLKVEEKLDHLETDYKKKTKN